MQAISQDTTEKSRVADSGCALSRGLRRAERSASVVGVRRPDTGGVDEDGSAFKEGRRISKLDDATCFLFPGLMVALIFFQPAAGEVSVDRK